jgi:hypothetical protein
MELAWNGRIRGGWCPRCRSNPKETLVVATPEQKNFEEIARLEGVLRESRANASTARETEAIREIGLEIAIAIREIGAMLINVGWEQSYATEKRRPDSGS